MTTYNRSLTLATGGNTITQNVTTADSVVVTVTVPGGYTVTISTSNCSSNKSSMVSGSSNTITFSSTGNYSCNYFASRITRQYGNYRSHDYIPEKHKATAYCKPVYIPEETATLY